MGQGKRATKILALVHTNVCGPFDVQARGDYIYFITFTKVNPCASMGRFIITCFSKQLLVINFASEPNQ